MTRSHTGVCSWSLQQTDAGALAGAILAAGVSSTQLALDPVRLGMMDVAELKRRFGEAGITVVSGMMAMEGEDYSTLQSIRITGGIVPDATWPANLRAAAANARVASELGISLVTFHAGFVPAGSTGNRHAVLVDRLKAIAAAFDEHGIRVALETGQESADTLLALLAGLDGIGVNFDPANMILYGMGDPVKAFEQLAPHVLQVHVKDAVRSAAPDEWGTEVPVGEGDVDWASFFAAWRGLRRPTDLVIEREAGTDRIADVRKATRIIERHAATTHD